VPTFADRGVSRGQRNGSPRPLICRPIPQKFPLQIRDNELLKEYYICRFLFDLLNTRQVSDHYSASIIRDLIAIIEEILNTI
jgi:hypothetical protein